MFWDASAINGYAVRAWAGVVCKVSLFYARGAVKRIGHGKESEKSSV